MRKLILLLLFLFNTFFIYGQSEKQKIFTTGYIVNISGDTVYGKLAILSPEESCKRLEFKNSLSETVQTFYPKEIIVYKRGMDIYSTRNVLRPESHIGNKNMFVKILVSGKVNVYQYNYFENESISTGPGTSFGGPSQKAVTDYYLEKTDVFKHIIRLYYKNDLWGFFKGDNEMVTKVRRSEYEYEEIPQMIKEYNQTHR